MITIKTGDYVCKYIKGRNYETHANYAYIITIYRIDETCPRGFHYSKLENGKFKKMGGLVISAHPKGSWGKCPRSKVSKIISKILKREYLRNYDVLVRMNKQYPTIF